MNAVLTRRHGLGDNSLQTNFSLSQFISRWVFDLQSSQSIGQSSFNLGLGTSLQFRRQDWVSDSLFDGGNVGFQSLSSFVLLGKSFIGSLELFSLVNHLFNFFRRQSTNSVRDSDVRRLTGRLFDGSNLQDTVSINFEDSFQDWFTSWHHWDVLQVEFTQQSVFFTVNTFTLVDWELNGGLVVSTCGKGSSLDGWNSSVSWNNDTEHVTLHTNT
ncbi:hypothetical protein WN66_00803 [Saccharomyces cerevisiae]|nr:hypothetical protein WN66_00803 [Saccharomyces cerevisiae]